MKRMRRMQWMGLVFVVLLFSVNVFAQEVTWEIKQHSTDLETLKEEVTEYVNQGYVPLGITFDGKELYILYLQEPDSGMEAWLIEWYNNRDEIQKGVTAKMNQGYMPRGITYTGDALYVLYVKMKNSATAWQLLPSATNLKAVQKTIQPYINKGYIPVGIAFYKNEYWTMLLLIPNTNVKSWKIETYQVGSHSDQINANIEKGYLPWDIEYSGKDRIDILYVGF